MNLRALIRRYARYVVRARRPALASAGLTLLRPMSGVLVLLLVKALVDEVFVAGRLERLGLYLVAYAALMGVSIVLDYAATRVDAAVTEQIALDIRADLYRHVLGLSPGSAPKYGVGDVLSHMSSDIDRAEYLVYSGPLAVIANTARVLFFTGFLFLLSWKLTLCALLVVPLYALASGRASPRIRRAARVTRRLTSSWTALAEERLGAAPLVHAYSAQDAEAARFRRQTALARRASLRGTALQARLSATIELVGAVAGLLVITVGAADIHARALSVGALIAFLGSVGSLYGPARSLAGAWSRFHRAAAGAQRVAELLDTPSRVQEREGARSLGRVRGALEFRDVRFGYVRGPEVLKGVCFAVQPGETVAVVGSSGAGKSTLVGLALRLHDPTGGSVRIDGEDLTELTLQSVRRAVCPVFQDAYVFRGSVRENLAYGAPDADEQRLLAAARAAHADGFVEALQGRYAASVGPRGGWLSGGQRQRLALARALVRDAPILILDEATAALDSETEDLVQDAMSRLAGSRTLLVVAHRLSSVQRADRVIVLHEGRVVESAPPQTLLAGPSRCRELFAGQLAGLRPAA